MSMQDKNLTSYIPVVCPLTGIPFRVELESPIANLTCVHPFSQSSVVHEIVRKAAERGIKLPTLYSPKTLAGMLLTILASENLCLCKDFIAANSYLADAGPGPITETLLYLCNRSSYRGFPKLALLDFTLNHYWGFQANADGSKRNEAADLLRNYVRVCGGHIINDARIQIEIPEKKKDKIKVYTDRAKQEASNLRTSKDNGSILLEKLAKACGHKYPKVIEDLKSTLRNLAIVKKERRQNLADMLEMVFEDSEDAAELAEILRKANSDSIQKDLETVSGIDAVSGIQKTTSGRIKVDFLSKLSKNQ